MDPDKSRTHNKRDEVMIEFQHSMLEMTKSFLAAQERVMLAYLSSSAQDPESQEPYRQIEFSSPTGKLDNGFGPTQSSTETAKWQPEWQQQEQFVENAVVNTQPTAGESIQRDSAPQADPPNGRYVESGHRQYAQWTTPERETGEQATIELNRKPQQASVPSPQPAPIKVAVSDAVSAESLIASLLEIVSERTGYPPEMLDPSLDMEADLGIDSIKRVEILTSLRKLLPESRREQLEGSIEQVVGIKSLQGIIDWIRQEFSDTDPTESDEERASVKTVVGV